MVLYDHVQHLAFIASPAPLPPTSITTTFDSEKTPEKGFSLLVFSLVAQLSSSFGDAQHGGVRLTLH